MTLKTMPVQTNRRGLEGKINERVHMKAYEVYCQLFGEQQALIEGWCRGGFGTGELVAYLYASGFPRNEWRARVDEALEEMVL